MDLPGGPVGLHAGWDAFQPISLEAPELEFLYPEQPEADANCFFVPRLRGGDELSASELAGLSTEEQERFRESGAKEWATINQYKAVTVIPPAEARRLLKDKPPSRCLRSRMVRRWKPGEGVETPYSGTVPVGCPGLRV